MKKILAQIKEKLGDLKAKLKKTWQWLVDECKKFKMNIIPLLIYECLYFCVGTFGVYPGTRMLINGTLSLLHLNFVEGSNLAAAVKNPIFDVVALGAIIVLVYYTMVEYVAIITCFNESRNQRKVYTWPLIKYSLRRALAVFKPKNFQFVLLIILAFPLTDVGLTSNFMKEWSLPEFIMSYIKDNPLLFAGFIATILLLIFKVFQFLFIFHYYTLDQPEFKSAAGKSKELIKGRLFSTAGLYMTADMIIAFVSFVSMLLLMGFLTLINNTNIIENLIAGANLEMHSIVFLGGLSGIVSVISTIISIVNLPFILMILSACFYHACDEKGCPISTDPRFTIKPERFWTRNRQIVALCLMFVAVLSFKTFSILNLYNENAAGNMAHKTLVAGHRGDTHDAPENSKAGLLKAIAIGADYVEIDVAETKDSVLVVSHDNNLKRLTGEDVNIWNSNYADLQKLDYGSSYSPDFAGERIMTLDEAMTLCKDKIKMSIELKPTKHDHDLVEKAVRLFEKNNFYQNGFFASLNYPTLEKVKKMNPRIKTCLNTFVALGNLQLLPVDIYSVEASFVTKNLLKQVHNRGKELWVWTVNREDLMDDMIALGVDAIVTDNPAGGLAAVQENAPDRIDQIKEAITQTFINLQ